jgi:hypothetical protein
MRQSGKGVDDTPQMAFGVRPAPESLGQRKFLACVPSWLKNSTKVEMISLELLQSPLKVP